MALMKKFNSGGSVDADLLDQQMNSSLKKFNLKSKDERKVRDALMKLSGYMNDPEGKSFSVSQTDRKYTVSGEGAEQFTGSADEVRSNWLTGSLKIKDDKDVMSVAAAVYDDAIRNLKPSSTSQETAKSTAPVRIKELSDYVINDFYGTSGNYGNKRLSWKNDDEIKENTMLAGASLANSYLRNPVEGNDSDEAKEYISWIQAAKDAADKKDWVSFEQASHKLGWDYSRLFLTQDEQNAIKAKDEAAKAEDETAAAERALNSYNSAGLSDVVKKALFEGGFTEQVDSWAEGHENNWLKLLSQKQGATTWKNPTTGKFVSYDKEGKIWSGADENRFSPAFGFSWGWDDANKTMRLYKPSELKLNTNLGIFTNPYQHYTESDGMELKHNIPNTRIFGYTTKTNNGLKKDILGRTDILGRLQVIQNDGSKFWLTQKDDGKYYTVNGFEYNPNLKITGYNNVTISSTPVKDLFPQIMYNEKPSINTTVQEAYNKIKSLQRSDGSFFEIGGKYDNYARYLAWSTAKDPTVLADSDLQGRILELLANYNNAKEAATTKAKHGTKLQKLQSGAAFQARLKAVREEQKQKTEQPQGGKPVKDLTGTFKGMSDRDKWLTGLEYAGDVASIAPGLAGAGGAGLSFLAGIAKDVNGDGKIEWGKHALNFGFIGASLLGLGATKTAIKGLGLAAKTADKAIDVGKAVDKLTDTKKIAELSKTTHFSGLAEDVSKVKKVLNQGDVTKLSRESFKTLAEKSVPKYTKNVSGQVDDIMKSFDKVVDAANTPITLRGQAGKYTVDQAKNLATYAGNKSKYLGKGLQAWSIGSGIQGGAQAVMDARDPEGKIDLSYIKSDDIHKALMGAVSAGRLTKDLLNAHALKRISPEMKKSFEKIPIKGKDVDLEPVKAKTWNPWKRKDSKVDQLFEQVKSNYTKEEYDDVKKALRNLSSKDFKIKLTKEDFNFNPDVMSGYPSPLNIKMHNRASGLLEKAGYKYTPKSMPKKVYTEKELKKFKDLIDGTWAKNISAGKFKFKSGGLILKASSGISVQKVYDTKKQYQFNNNNPIYLPHSNVVNDGSDWRFDKDNKYTLEYSKAIESLDDNWWNANKTKIQGLTVGTNVKINDLPTFKKLATDYKPGRIHEFTFNKQNLGIPEVDKLSTGPINPNASVENTGGNTVENTGGNTGGKGIGAGISQEKGIFQGGDKTVLDNLPNLVSNIMSYGINQAGATKAYGHLRKSLIDSMYQLPYQKHQYFRTSTPYTLLTEQAAGNYSSQVNRIASTMADIDKATGARLRGAAQVEEMRTKGRVSDFEYNEKIRNAQDQSNLQIDSANTETLAKNRQLVSDTLSKLGQLNYNEQMLKTHNLNNLNLGVYQWLKNTKDAKNRSSLFEAYSNPEYLKLTTAYNDHQAKKPDLLKTIENEWKSKHKDKIWDESYAKSDTRYKDWETENTRYESILKPINNNYNMMKVATQMNIPYSYYSDKLNPWYFKKGGNLAPGEYLEAVRLQSESKIKVKEIEMFYKMIMHNNAMLQKSLIKVFK